LNKPPPSAQMPPYWNGTTTLPVASIRPYCFCVFAAATTPFWNASMRE
jgi:hypothetical protein